MKIKLVIIVCVCIATQLYSQKKVSPDWKAKWISTMVNQNMPNTWLAYRKTVQLNDVPSGLTAKIAVDSKYWLWINGKMVVFEGGLKRGPNPVDTYYDEVELAPYLKTGSNTIAVLSCYFGKDGFSHKSSGRAGLLFDCQSDGLNIISDESWKCSVLKSFQTAPAPFPNFRLSESNILYDAQQEPGDWQGSDFDDTKMDQAMEIGAAGAYPWNKLILRPIPLWKDFGLKNYLSQRISSSSFVDTIICELPYNAQLTPYFEIESAAGKRITICTDNYLFYNGGEANIRAEYITKNGLQTYENYGWINGQRVYYIVPKGVKVLALKYRETGYDTEFSGSFSCSDPFLNEYWEKARRTLYLTMRDGYMDCPDRERAQWTGDATNESAEAFYALSTSSHALSKKWLYELIDWQRPDGSLYSPTPAGNWTKELPDQIAASIGYYGLWNYYLNTGDKETIADLYGRSKRYLSLWEKDPKGTMLMREGGWAWGDWGEDRDMLLIFNSWYYLAVKGMHRIAVELGYTNDANAYVEFMKKFKISYNEQFWNGQAYRSPLYKDETDDRVQALAVVSGLADADKYPMLLKVLQTEKHASPYMEKYVFEAFFLMGKANEGIARFKKRFGPMVANPNFTTLFEGWGIGEQGYGGGTVNHAWSGGGLTVLSQNLCGIYPLTPGYKVFGILPNPGSIANAKASISSVAGQIECAFINTGNTFLLTAKVPDHTTAILGIPFKKYSRVMLNGKVVWENGKYVSDVDSKQFDIDQSKHLLFKVGSGTWELKAK